MHVSAHYSASTRSCAHQAAAALWSLAKQHYANQIKVAEAGGIAPLAAVIGLNSIRAQEQAAGALAALARDNPQNVVAIAGLLVSLVIGVMDTDGDGKVSEVELASRDRAPKAAAARAERRAERSLEEKQASAKAARAISYLARAHPANQAAIAAAGGVGLLVSLLDAEEGGVLKRAAPSSAPERTTPERGTRDPQRELPQRELPQRELPQRELEAAGIHTFSHEPHHKELAHASAHHGAPRPSLPTGTFSHEPHHKELAMVQKDLSSAIWHMTKNSEPNQIAAKEAGAIMPLIALLEGNPIVRPDVGGALWSLAANEANQVAT